MTDKKRRMINHLLLRKMIIYWMMKNRILLWLTLLVFTSPAMATNNNAVQARKLFDHTYNMVFGTQGSTLHYNVNLVGIMKIDGTIWYKGKKSRFEESRYLSWNDGVKDYWVDKKKKVVTLYDANSVKKDKYSSKFTFNAEDYNYALSDSDEGFVVTLNAKKNVKGIKHLKAVIHKKTLAPISMKIKVLWFWTTVNISQFRSGNISDDLFVFPAEKYKSYAFVDERGKANVKKR